MPGAVSILRILRGCSKPSTRPRAEVWVSGCRSAGRSLKNIRADSGPSRITGPGLRSLFLFLAVRTAARMRLSSAFVMGARRFIAKQTWTKISGAGGLAMPVSTPIDSDSDVRAFIEEYFEAWSGTDENLILSYYSETISLEIPGTIINGKAALRDQ